MREATYENPHTFAEAVQYLAEGNHISYEVRIPLEGHPHGCGGALMTRESWLESVKDRSFVDYDGMGDQMTETGEFIKTQHYGGWIKPSQAAEIDPRTKFILWYNR